MLSALLSHLVKLDDFHELSHTVILRNNTSGLLIAENKSVSIVEFKPDGIVVRCPKDSCVITHKLSLFVMEDYLFNKLKRLPEDGAVKGAMELLGKVVDIEKKDKVWIVDISFTQYNVKEWKQFYQVYLDHQENISDLSDVELRFEKNNGEKKNAV